MQVTLALISLTLSIVCFAIRELYYHGKLKWQDVNEPTGFFGKRSDLRKYKFPLQPPKANWYYKLNDLSYKEIFPLSGTLFVWVTDCPHFFQFMIFNFLALSLTFALGWNWCLFASLMIGIRVIHWLSRKLLSK